MSDDLREKFESARSIAESDPSLASVQLHDILSSSYPNDSDSLKIKEASLDLLSTFLIKQEDSASLRKLLTDLRPWFAVIPKAKTAKVIRSLIDSISKVPNSNQTLLEVCQEQAEWASQEKRTFLRQRIDLRLASLYLANRNYQDALSLISKLSTEVKRLDDKLLLVEIHLLESKVHNSVRNLPKSRAALTAARTAANAVYVAPSLQADIDTQSGTLHAEENDFKTAFSYFYEAFEQLSALDDPRAVPVLKYMLLCKIMADEVEDVPSIITSKGGLKYAGPDVDALRAVAKAYANRSLEEFESVLLAFSSQLKDDPVVHGHLNALYDMLLEQNLKRIIEPYSHVEVVHLSKLINLPVDRVEAKLSQMILDKKFRGTLDQGIGVLEVFDEALQDSIYPPAIDTMENLSKVVDGLFARSMKLMS